ncbi:DNA/pantothenate metabolism flavoprotein [Lentilactobacillus fungorum]|uniref:Coenzyme A biosynthesis bifunctional protein CoaBC n=1 Tax=Lentilactobacillus fungorum TaxID=2201250 RepID=A0ABQ3VXF2_9LACO|nr:bifunctional phosphopantothenoylcysteine decarboxylase/phosphopantothenate--cysteine ligase CoaBC [Lentilactobacillus fungorum]GHP12856.1 DNA/pantothenate metabolism flavoprotein [Lentilactobacillus fungorum]
MLSNQNVALFVTGSIAVYKSLTLTRLLVKAGNDVHVIMTKAAQQFVKPLTFQTLSKNPVIVDDFSGDDPTSIPHVKIADDADLAIIAPATANTIAKLANGIADNVASAALLAIDQPIFVVPAMNNKMLANFATQQNMQELADHGIHMMPAVEGFLAEGYSGRGRMPEPEAIFDWVNHTYTDASDRLSGKKLIVTAGGTREALDPVRYLTNRSSGKMGYAIAAAAQGAGAEVTLISANSALPVPNHVRLIRVESANELLAAVKKAFPVADGLIMAAAVADYRPAVVANQKIKKTAANQTMTLELVRNPDILQTISTSKRPGQVVVGFAAETNDLIANAAKKIKAKKLDLIVANDVANKQIGFNADQNQVTFLFADGQQIKSPLESKAAIAERLIQLITDHFLN